MTLDSNLTRLDTMVLNGIVLEEEYNVILLRAYDRFLELSDEEKEKYNWHASYDYKMSLPSLARYIEKYGS